MFWKRKRPARVEVYTDAENRWRWRAIAGNGRVVAAAEQGYASKYYAATKALPYADQHAVPILYLAKEEQA